MSKTRALASILVASIICSCTSASRIGDSISDERTRAALVESAGFTAESSNDLLIYRVNNPLSLELFAVVYTANIPMTTKVFSSFDGCYIDISKLDNYNHYISKMNIEVNKNDICKYAIFYINQFACELVDCAHSCEIIEDGNDEYRLRLIYGLPDPFGTRAEMIVQKSGQIDFSGPPVAVY